MLGGGARHRFDCVGLAGADTIEPNRNAALRLFWQGMSQQRGVQKLSKRVVDLKIGTLKQEGPVRDFAGRCEKFHSAGRTRPLGYPAHFC